MIAALRLTASLVALLVLLPGSAVAGDGWALHHRLYLLGSEQEFLYWSVDRHDPELGLGRDERQCSAARTKGMPGYQTCSFSFLPGSRIAESLTWTSANPARFHLALDVVTPGTPTVTIDAGGNTVTATEASPDVWEATVTGSLPADTWSLVTITVTSSVPHLTASLALDGASYIDLAQPVTAAGVPQLMAQEGAGGPPRTLDTKFRSFAFNDDRWEVTSFQGDLSETRDFEVVLDRPAEVVMAWVEAFGTGFTHDVLRGRDPDARKLTEAMATELYVDGERVDRGGNHGVYGVGTDHTATTDVGPGAVRLRVARTPVWPTTMNHGHPYTAHVLVVEGDRTLRRMRWTSMFGGYPGITATNAPLVGVCPGSPQQRVPVTDAVRTFKVDMRADTAGGPTSRWALSFLLPPNTWFLCSEMSDGDSMRFTFPHRGVHLVGGMIERDTTHAEWRETVLEFDVRYTYSPAA